MNRFSTQYQSTNPFLALSDVYRYGFNGKETYPHLTSSMIDFGYRVYCHNLGVWMSPDPDSKLYVNLSPYAFGANSPIINVDADGRRVYFIPGLGYDPKLGDANSPYVKGFANALTARGIQNKTIDGSAPWQVSIFESDEVNHLVAALPDMQFVMNKGQRPSLEAINDIRVQKAAYAIANDLLLNPINPEIGEEMNIVGTSQGSVTAALAAIAMLENPEKYGLDENFKIDNLVLVGAPVHKKSALYKKLQQLEADGKIDKVHYDNYQSKNSKGRSNDAVTGVSGRTKTGARFRAVGLVIQVVSSLLQGKSHPHLDAADNKPLDGGADFGSELVDKMQADGIEQK